MPEENEPAQSPPPEQSTLLGNIAPDEMLARGMQSVKMTSGATGTWQPPTLQECAQLFPGYEVLRLLGRGGMGAVYQARQIELDRLVAIKLLPLEISVDKDFADRFRREARAMAKLNHPNIIAVYDFGTTREGHLFFVMEFVEGANLYDIIHQVGLDGDQALSIAEQVCTALAYAHSKGIVHRDIKPANVMIDTESHVKVADFGLARLVDNNAADLGHTMTGTVMGTPDYMAPEQMKGMNVDHRADIYSLGVMLYEMLCREVPKGIFDPPSHRTPCDARIDQIVIRSLQQVPDRRYQSTTEMKSDILSARHPVIVPDVVNEPPAPRASAPPAPPRKFAAPKVAKSPGAPGRPPTPVARPVGNNNPTEVVSQAASPLPRQAVMKAIATPAPVASKSKMPLYMGIGAAVAVIAAAAFFLLKPKEEKLTQAQIYAREHANETKDAGPSAVAEHWQDLLGDPSKLRLSDGAERMPEGLRLSTDGGKARVVAGSKLPRDAALRIRTTFDGGRPFLHGRVDSRMGYYDLGATVDGNTIRLGLFQQSSQNKINLRDFPLPKPLRRGQEYDLELRIVGQSLTAKLNGEIVGTFVDATLSQGEFEVVGADRAIPSVLVKSLEFLDLETRANASSSLAPAKPSPAAAAAAPAPHLSPSNEPRVASEPWEDLLADPAKLNLFKVEDISSQGLRLPKGGSVTTRRRAADGAIRVVMPFNPAKYNLTLQVRSDGQSVYGLNIATTTSMGLQRKMGTAFVTIGHFPIANPPAIDSDCEFELRVVGPILTARLNGVVVGSVRDDNLTDGMFGMTSTLETVPVKLLQFLSLKQTTIAAPAPAAPVAPKNGKGINLLALVDLKRDVVQGTWSVKPEGLSLDATDKFGICEMPYEPPKEYDFEAEFTPTSGGNNVNFHIRAGDANVIWKLHAYGRTPPIYGFDLLDRKFMFARTEATITHSLQIETGKRYTTRVEVRAGSLRALINGNEMLAWSGDFSRLSTEPPGQLRNERALGVGSYGRRVVFHRVEVFEVTGRGKFTATAPAPPAVSAASPSAATKDKPFVNTLGQEFVPVPGTSALFCRWQMRVKDYAAYARANKVDDAWTKQQKDGVPVSRDPDYPVVGVSWNDTHDFCKWLTEKETAEGKLPPGMKYRLPTDAEWSSAVGLTKEDGATPKERSGKNRVDYPWGIDFPPSKANVGNYADTAFHQKFSAGNWVEGYTDGYPTTSPVGSFAPNKFGLYDLGGNVWEWCEDVLEPDAADRVLRGGSWFDGDHNVLLSAYRYRYAPGNRGNEYGFRVVLAPAIVAALSPSASQAKQTIDVLALTDALKDRVMPGAMGLANEWEKVGGLLRYKTDGKSGKVMPPVAINARRYELEVAYRRMGGAGGLHIDLPIAGQILPLTLDQPRNRPLNDRGGEPLPDSLPAEGRYIIRYDAGTTEQPDRITIHLNGALLTTWTGPLTAYLKRGEEHPDFPGQPLTSIFCRRDTYEFTAWTLRVFEGDAKVLRAAGAPTAATVAAGSEAGFRPLFDGKTFAGWSAYGGAAPSAAWRVQEGAVMVTGDRSWLVTKETFGDFELRLDWKVGPNGNGGIFFRMPAGEGSRPLSAPEFQLCARDVPDTFKTGSVYNVLRLPDDASLPTGEWNTARLVVRGSHCEHWVNEKLVLSYDLKSEEWKKQWQASKFGNDPRFAQATEGWIALQGWTGEIAYRNIRVHPLPAAP